MLKTLLIFSLFLGFAAQIQSEERVFGYTHYTLPPKWTEAKDENHQVILLSPNGTQLILSNFGYDVQDPVEVLEAFFEQDPKLLKPRTNKKGLSYYQYEKPKTASELAKTIILFSGGRYMGPSQGPNPAANGFFFQGKNILKDIKDIQSIIDSIHVETDLWGPAKRQISESDNFSFEIPVSWIKAPYMGSFEAQYQYINESGAIIHIDYLRETTESTLDFTKGFVGYPNSHMNSKELLKNKAGVNISLWFGSTNVPTNPNWQTNLTLITFATEKFETGVIVLLGSVGDRGFINKLIESIRVERKE